MAIAHVGTVVLFWVASFGVVTSTVFSLMAVYAALRFRGKGVSRSDTSFLPPISLLKPLHGSEPDLERRLRTFFEQDYPTFEILFCARSDSDEGLNTARSVASLYPHIEARFLSCGEPPWPNARTYSLEVMRRAAKHEILVTADSDVQVDRSYLRAVVQPFREEKVGLVTCVYRGVTRQGLWARMEALGMSVEMTAGVLVAERLEGMRFALGPSMAMRQSTIEKIGGFGAVAQYYADDFILGNWTARVGETVVLSRYVIEHHVLNSTFRASMAHQQGWATSTRFSRPLGHVGSVLTFAVPFGCLGLLASLGLHHVIPGVAMLLLTIVNRIALCVVIAELVVNDRSAVRSAWLYPFRDLLGFWFWAVSFFRRRVKYRGEPYELLPQGRLRKLV